MPRPIADVPSFLDDTGAREKRAAMSVLSMETCLWIEVSLLIGLGLIMIYSASSIVALRKFGDAAHYMKRQMLCIGLGVITMFVVSFIPYRWYEKYVKWLLIMIVLALVLVLIPGLGAEINNARRWFHVKGFSFQPAEYAKVIWVIFLSVSLNKKQEKIKQISIAFWPHIILCGILCLLLLVEPDFGTTFMIGCLTVMMLALGGVPLRHLFLLAPVALLGFYRFVYRVPYRWERVTAFRNPWIDKLDSGYQLIQAWIAVGAGGLVGKGLGAGSQKLFYLPESYTDFILAVIGEELGFLGIAIVTSLFLAIFATGLRISRQAPDYLAVLLSLGLTMLITLQALLNMAVVLGLVPTKGMPLPFISYGGSAFLANCIAVGVLANIARSSAKRIE
jgi:cell division protein FtsW